MLLHGYNVNDLGLENKNTYTQTIKGLREGYLNSGCTVYEPIFELHLPTPMNVWMGGGLENPKDKRIQKDVTTVFDITKHIVDQIGPGNKNVIFAGFSGGGPIAHRLVNPIEEIYPNTSNSVNTFGAAMGFEQPNQDKKIPTRAVSSSDDEILKTIQQGYNLRSFFAMTAYRDVRTNQYIEHIVIAAGQHLDMHNSPLIQEQINVFVNLAKDLRDMKTI